MWTVPSQAEASKPEASSSSSANARSPIRRRRSPDPRRSGHAYGHGHAQSLSRSEAIASGILREAAIDDSRRSFTFGARSPLPPAPSLPNPVYRSLSPPPESTDANESEYGRSARRPFWAHLDSAAARLRVDAFADPARQSVRRNGPQHSRYYRPSGADVRDGAVSDLPPLRRMSGRRYVVDQPLRSLPPPEIIIRRGPEEGSSENESMPDRPHDDWANMSFGILPDTLRPSADSSFTSAAASASFTAPRSHGSSTSDSRSQSANSSSTSLTTLSADVESGAETLYRTMQEALDRACEDSNHGSDTEADEDDGEEAPRRPHRRYRPFPLTQPYYIEPLAIYRHSRSMRHRSREASRFVRHYQGYVESRTASPPLARENASISSSSISSNPSLAITTDEDAIRSNTGAIVDGPISSTSTILPPMIDTTTASFTPTIDTSFEGSTSLEHMRRILSRMARDDDIPDEWWASAGLTPTLMSGRHSPVEAVAAATAASSTRYMRPAEDYRLRLPRLRRENGDELASP